MFKVLQNTFEKQVQAKSFVDVLNLLSNQLLYFIYECIGLCSHFVIVDVIVHLHSRFIKWIAIGVIDTCDIVIRTEYS